MRRTGAPVYDSELGFYQALGIRWETGRRYRKLGALRPDAKTSSGSFVPGRCPTHRKSQGSHCRLSGRPNQSPGKPSRIKPCLTKDFRSPELTAAKEKGLR